jgi:hypothetical protein
MKRAPLFLLPALLLFAAPAAQAAPSCTRGGAKLLAASGSVRVVSLKGKRGRTETRHDRILGCRTSTGRRFTMFEAVDHGEDEIRRDTFTIVQGRYVGVFTDFVGGTGDSFTAATYDMVNRKRLHTTSACDADEDGVDEAVFFKNGGMAYSCGQLRVADGKGDRQIEPAGVTQLAVSADARLYWTANGVVKSLGL